MSYVVALTGGIGSGKSTIAKVFSILGADIIDADVISREVVALNKPALAALYQRFGKTILNTDSTLNRKSLRHRIFNSAEDKKWIDNLLHPLIHAETQYKLALTKSSWSLWVVPLLVENQLQYFADRVLVVDIDKKTQIVRVMNRDGISFEQANNIIMLQATRESRLTIANDVIDNSSSGSIETVIKQVAELNQRYIALSQEKYNRYKEYDSSF